jgi:hypothetical protein
MPASINIAVLRDLTPCSIVDGCQTTRRHIPEAHNLK